MVLCLDEGGHSVPPSKVNRPPSWAAFYYMRIRGVPEPGLPHGAPQMSPSEG